MRLGDLAVGVLQDVGVGAVEHAGPAQLRIGEARRVMSGGDPLAARLHADQPHAGIFSEGVEQADGVRAAADARHARVRQPAGLGHDLRPRLGADHRLEVAHDGRVGVRAERRAEQVVRVSHVRHPVTDRLVDGVLERARACVYRPHLRAEQLHAQDIRLLAGDIHRAHVDDALQPQQRGRGGRCHAMLSRARLGDDAALAHALRQERLPQRVVDLVRAGVGQVFAFEIDLRAALAMRAVSRRAWVSGVGRPTYVRSNASNSAWKAASACNARYAASNSASAGISVSGTNCPPNAPNLDGRRRTMDDGRRTVAAG